MVERVDYRGVAALRFLRDRGAVIPVDMSVEKQLRVVFVNKLIETFEAAVCLSVEIVEMTRRRVGHEDIYSSVYKQLRKQLFYPAVHLLFRIHILAVAVAVRAAEPGDPKSLVFINRILDTDASLGLALEMLVVIPVNVYEGAFRHCYKKFKVAYL